MSTGPLFALVVLPGLRFISSHIILPRTAAGLVGFRMDIQVGFAVAGMFNLLLCVVDFARSYTRTFHTLTWTERCGEDTTEILYRNIGTGFVTTRTSIGTSRKRIQP